MNLGRHIRRLRLKKGMTLAEAAEKIGATRQQWEQWESSMRTPGLKSLVKIARSLQCTPEELFFNFFERGPKRGR